MNPESKQRLVGVIVLVVFIALLIPFLFSDGAKKRQELIVDEEIDIADQTIGADVPGRYVDVPISNEKDAVGFEETDLHSNIQNDLPDSRPSVMLQEQAVAQVKPKVVLKPVTSKKTVKSATKKKVAESVKKKKVIPKSKPAATKDDSKISGTFWSVQVGSFSDQALVERMVSRLQKKGYHVYLQKISTSKGNMIRVLVGKESNKGSAESLSRKLKSDLNINGYVLSNKR